MFINLINFSHRLESYVLNHLNMLLAPISGVWVNVFIEVLVLQVVLLFFTIQLLKATNHFRQLILLLLLIITLCIYLSVMQLEFFACFMFLAEFTVLFFFYVLFLHLRTLTWQPIKSVVGVGAAIWIVALLGVLFFFSNTTLIPGVSNLYVALLNVYKVNSLRLLTDFAFMWAVFFKYYLFLHVCIGLILLFLTLLIFTIISMYTYFNIFKTDVFQPEQAKLYMQRGFTEQTGDATQKVIQNNNIDK